MSDKKLDLILQKLVSIETEIKEFREETKADLQVLKAGQKGSRSEMTDRFSEVAAELKDTRETIHTFRFETEVNFKKVDRRVKLIESDLDETMVKVSEITLPRN